MYLAWEPIKSQKFDIGRTINFAKCDCKECDFLHCPKNNYALKMKRKIPAFHEFWNCWSSKIIEINKLNIIDTNFPNKIHLYLTYDLINEMMECISFPKGIYWSVENNIDWKEEKDISDCRYESIALVKISRKGKEVKVGEIRVYDGYLLDYDLSEPQERLGNKISSFINQIIISLIECCQQENKDSLVGWLSPEGRHYKCKPTQHMDLSRRLGYTEIEMEGEGWLKIAFSDTSMPWLGTRKPTAEQRNWLSLHGWEVD